MNPIQTRTRGRRTSLAVVLALVAAAFALVVPSATADPLYTVTAKVRLSSLTPVNGSVNVLRQDPDPATTFSPYGTYGIGAGALDVDLPAGTYKLELVSDALDAHQWYAGANLTAADESGASAVTVGSNADLGTITFPVRKLTVTVQDENGQPVPNAGVSYGTDPGTLVENSKTNAQGVAVLRDRPTDQDLYLQAADDAFDPSSVQTVSADTADAPVTLTMTRRATISGKVTGVGGTGLGLVSVAAFNTVTQELQGTPALTDAQGNFTITGVPAGDDVSLLYTDTVEQYAPAYWHDETDAADADTFSVTANVPISGNDAQLSLNPAPSGIADLAGVVKGAGGAPLPNVVVQATRNGVVKGSARTGRDGRYTFTSLTSGAYQVHYQWAGGQPGALPYVDQWNAGSAAPLTITADAAGADRNVTLQQYGAISGSLTDSANLPVDGATVTAVDVDGDEFAADASTGSYRVAVPPGQYRLRFSGPVSGPFITQYWNRAASLVTSKTVSAGSGATTGGINAKLTQNLESLALPTVTGAALVGTTLTASTGSWNLAAGNGYAYTWLRGTTPVGSAATYKLTAADAGARISVKVVASHGALSGMATSLQTAAVKRVSTTKVTGTSPTKKVVKVTVTVSVAGVANPGGTLTIKRGTTTVKTKVAVVNGKAVVTLKAQPTGKQAYTAVYAGTALVAGSTSAKATVKVK